MQSPNKNKLLDGVFETKAKLQELDKLKEAVHQKVHANMLKDYLDFLNGEEKNASNIGYDHANERVADILERAICAIICENPEILEKG